MPVGEETGAVLDYGSVRLRLCSLYTPGEEIRVDDRWRLSVVSDVEEADVLYILSLLEKEEDALRPTCLCVMFSQYFRKRFTDLIDHASTATMIQRIPQLTMKLDRALYVDLTRRSITASLAFQPKVRLL